MEHYTIELPRGIRNFFKRRELKKRLAGKLNEYIKRCAQPKNQRQRLDAWHKIHVLSVLLEHGRVDIATLTKRMQVLPEFDRFLFGRACDVIRIYCEGIDPKAVGLGGTGLPK